MISSTKRAVEASPITATFNQMESETLAVTIVMPCLNEAETPAVCIQKAVTAIRDLDIDGEVVVADNGSTATAWGGDEDSATNSSSTGANAL